ncbi:MAG: AI-2E family transporter [Bacteroidales bacterium]|nr:AI-2E family transporter [Bacteroidales bacterium]
MNDKSVLAILLFLAFLGLMAWFFSDVLIYVFLALVLTILGRPLMRLFAKIKIKNWQFPSALSAVLTMAVIIGVFALLVMTLIPAVISDFRDLLSFDPESLSATIGGWLKEAEIWLKQKGLLQSGDNLSEFVTSYLINLLKDFSFANLFGNAMSVLSAIIIGALAVLFMTFFSLSDNQVFFKLVRKVIPISYRPSYDRILSTSIHQISRYFMGVVMEMIIIGILEGLFCYICGVPNALIIGFLGGLLNVIPYVGPLIGGALGAIIAVTNLLVAGIVGPIIWWTILKVALVFVGCNLIDNFVLQPLIYGRSVQAHPLEIFIVILIGAQIGGVLGMILAVPAYTLLRIIIKELFGEYYGSEEPTEEKPVQETVPEEPEKLPKEKEE